LTIAGFFCIIKTNGFKIEAMHTLLDDLSNLEFRVLIYSAVLKLPQDCISRKLHLHKKEISRMLKDIRQLHEYECLKEDLLEAFFKCPD
jgi:hypothetical protein